MASACTRTPTTIIGLAAAGLALLPAPAPGLAATTVGQTFAPDSSCGSNLTMLQSGAPNGQYTAPAAGVITSWSYQAGTVTPTLKLVVARAAGVANSFTTIGESQQQTPSANTLSTFGVRIPVRAGDVIGAFYEDGTSCGTAAPGYLVHFTGGLPLIGSTASYAFASGVHLDLAAAVEADADGDGFGDQTQDGCPGDPASQADCIVPRTRITKRPSSKVKRPRVTYKFRASEPGVSFECKLDRKPYKPCESPRKLRGLGRGRHKFFVHAIDAAGNLDPTPAKDKFRVLP